MKVLINKTIVYYVVISIRIILFQDKKYSKYFSYYLHGASIAKRKWVSPVFKVCILICHLKIGKVGIIEHIIPVDVIPRKSLRELGRIISVE